MACEEINSRVRSLRLELIALLVWDQLFWDPFPAKESDREAHTARALRRNEILDGLQEMHRQRLAAGSNRSCSAITDCEPRALFSRTTGALTPRARGVSSVIDGDQKPAA